MKNKLDVDSVIYTLDLIERCTQKFKNELPAGTIASGTKIGLKFVLNLIRDIRSEIVKGKFK